MIENGWRILVIQSKSELKYESGNLLVLQGDQSQMIPLDQLRLLMIDNLQVKISVALIDKLTQKHVKVIFCDAHHQPVSELCNSNGHTYAAGNLMRQTKWSADDKITLWKCIISNKIGNQAQVLKTNQKEGDLLLRQYIASLNSDNVNLIEGLAAKQYFVNLYGTGFCRRTECEINHALNYGYSIILSQTSRSISVYGCHPALGIEHHSESNPYNLSCDLMEPFRPIVDQYVLNHLNDVFTAENRKELIALMYAPVLLNGKNMELQTAIDLYVRDCIQYMNHESSRISEVRLLAA